MQEAPPDHVVGGGSGDEPMHPATLAMMRKHIENRVRFVHDAKELLERETAKREEWEREQRRADRELYSQWQDENGYPRHMPVQFEINHTNEPAHILPGPLKVNAQIEARRPW